MVASPEARHMRFQFDDHVLDTEQRELRCNGKLVPLEPQVFDVVAYLIANQDRVVTRDDIFSAVWRGRIVSDAALASRINAARLAIGDNGADQRLIRTLRGRGYRFIGSAREFVEPFALPESPERLTTRPPIPERPSVAVLPFVNMSADVEQDYFSDGIAEDIISALSRVRTLFVIARNSSFTYKEQSPDIRKVAQELGARYVIEGSVRKADNRVRVVVQLVAGETGKHLWSERYDRELADIFNVQDEITEAVVGSLQPELGKAEQERARLKRAENLDAWDAYQQGMWHTNRRAKSSLKTAIRCFQKSIELEPDFAPAYWGSTIAYFYTLIFGWSESRGEMLEQALSLARRAIGIDPDDSMSHTALGYALFVRRDHQAAIPALQTAIELDPNNYLAPRMLGMTLTGSGRASEALPYLHRALRLSPRDPLIGGALSWTAMAHFFNGEPDVGVELARKGMRLRQAPQTWTVTTLITILSHLGLQDEAERTCEDLLSEQPELSCAFVRANIPIVHPRNLERYIEGLRKAGLPK
jgi:TolB-like protein